MHHPGKTRKREATGKDAKRENGLPRNKTTKEHNEKMETTVTYATIMIDTSRRMTSASSNALGLNAVRPTLGSSFKAMNGYMIV